MAEPPSDAAESGTGLEPRDAFEVHRQMVVALFIATTTLVVLLAAGLLLSTATALMVVAGAGALGGFVSALRRLYAFQRIFPKDFFTTRHRIDAYLVVYSMIPSLVGTIAAVVLYLVFASRLVEGDLFPRFDLDTLDPEADAFRNFVSNWKPDGPTEYAKALVWSFIAGFSERFVPDLLERFASSQPPGAGAGTGTGRA